MAAMEVDTGTFAGYGFATLAPDGFVLDARFVRLDSGESSSLRAGTKVLSADEARARRIDLEQRPLGVDAVMGTRTVAIETRISDVNETPVDRFDFFLRLYLLSARLAQPNSLNLGGLELCSPIAWTTRGPCLPEHFEQARCRSLRSGAPLELHSVYHVPRMTDYVLPAGVRIMNTHNVRLGAYLSPGTMVTASGFCNTNAGTLGPAMVEGRISRGVTVGEGCHIGGGASLMGTTSGSGRVRVTIGRNCLIGANAGVGISLGDDSMVEAGCYVTAGSLVKTPEGNVVKAIELSERPGLLFRRNSMTGVIEAIPARGFSGLNVQLHSTETSHWDAPAMLLS
jgi:2,3,4,5-tetrahydropyridine-2,6-dicarboxylate N-succinyltransferase